MTQTCLSDVVLLYFPVTYSSPVTRVCLSCSAGFYLSWFKIVTFAFHNDCESLTTWDNQRSYNFGFDHSIYFKTFYVYSHVDLTRAIVSISLILKYFGF